ncbi:PREDICTED: tenascin-X-like [Branchiostoma belcheri]|uniref:Tenascin-X-like n=1 Tax=Branchiostoma belcheri TaxID=7741 RepID=A0A6P5AT92_BRABE|nr:PREDICTED: tenascin-X-like [Branchiostoma belcheri]
MLTDFTDLFDHNENKVLEGHDNDLISDITPEECAQRCLEGTTTVPEGECLSFDYWKSRTRCQLSRDNKDSAGETLGSNNIASFFSEHADQALGSHDDVIVTPPTVSPRTCALRCLLGEGSLSVGSCLSFDLDNNNPRCLLSSDNQNTAGQPLDTNTRFDHYQRNEFCIPNPCIDLHQWLCTNQANGYSCTCDPGWEGDSCDTYTGTITPQNCADLSAMGIQTSGTYHVGHPQPFQVSCDMDTDGGGWTVIQRRQDGSVSFDNTWDVYVQGFGDVSGELWIGLEHLHSLTSQQQHELYVYLEDWEGNTKYARYSTFAVGDSTSKYTATISDYTGDPTLTDDLAPTSTHHSINGKMFTTKDQDNDANSVNCGASFGPSGWWFPPSCGLALLNGQYLTGCSSSSSCTSAQGIVWKNWLGYGYSLKKTVMMIRPSGFPGKYKI